jgi:hypothetical protein
MLLDKTSDLVRQQALAALTGMFMNQGHPAEYAQHMATAVIFQTDLELRNAQLSRLIAWLQQEHPGVYTSAIALVEQTCAEFEKRVQT